jgi:hypothetical protein
MIEPGIEDSVATGPANVPDSAVDTFVSDHLLIRSEVETTALSKGRDVVLSAFLSTVTYLVAKLLFRGGPEEGVLQ